MSTCGIKLYLLLTFHFLVHLSSSSSPSRFSPPTRVSGFGSRAIRKSIFSRQSRILESDRKAKLWVYHDDDNALWFRNENGEDDEIKFCISTDKQGEWSIKKESDVTLSRAPLSENKNWVPIEGIYGVYQIPSGIIMVLIPKIKSVYEAPSCAGKENWWKIQKISSLELVHLSNSKSLTTNQVKEEIRQLQLLRRALKQHKFYCCRDSRLVPDMTKTLQTSFCQLNNDTTLDNWWTSEQPPDARFFWNQEAVAPLLCQRNKSDGNCVESLLQHTIPVTSAYIGVKSNLTANEDDSNTSTKYTQLLISRRSRFRAGTRFTRRGADATGNVANYAETEQVVLTELEGNLQKIASHIQIRGSIPLRWSSPADVKTYRPKVRIGTDPTAQAEAIRKHLVEQQDHYGCGVIFCNLVDKKSDQGRLGQAFDSVLQAVLDVYYDSDSTSDKIKHVWFDFHAEVKNGKWDRLSILLKNLKPYLKDHGYFEASMEEDNEIKIDSQQTSMIRTNCMDCLDRTNVVQSILGRFILFQQTCPENNPLAQKEFLKSQQLTLPWHQGEVAHRSLWADNADAISRLYAGTPALKRDFTRTGKRTKKGALDDGMNSLQRYYLNNFLDADRQEGMDLMVGHANFSNFLGASSAESNVPSLPMFGVHQAARKSFLGNLLGTNNQELGNQLDEIGLDGKANDEGDALDLRWVPGDLQSHLRSQADDAEEASSNTIGGKVFRFASIKALKAIDERSTSGLPWWCQVENDDMHTEENNLLDPHQRHPMLTRSQTFFFFVVGINAPMTLATSIVSLLGLFYAKDIAQHDANLIAKSTKKNDGN